MEIHGRVLLKQELAEDTWLMKCMLCEQSTGVLSMKKRNYEPNNLG